MEKNNALSDQWPTVFPTNTILYVPTFVNQKLELTTIICSYYHSNTLLTSFSQSQNSSMLQMH